METKSKEQKRREDKYKFERLVNDAYTLTTRNVSVHEKHLLQGRIDSDIKELTDLFGNIERYEVSVETNGRDESNPVYFARVTMKVMKRNFTGQNKSRYRGGAYDGALDKARIQALKLKDHYDSKRYMRKSVVLEERTEE